MQRIAFPDAPEWVQDVQLEGRSYRLRARWNTVSAHWSLDILTRSRVLIVAGLRMVSGTLLTAQFRDDRLPPGDFFVTVTGGTGDDYADFIDGRAVLIYATAAEIEGAAS